MSFIFISYSRQDQAYVSKLAQTLQTHQLPVWLDDSIDYGTTWPRVIQDHLEKCQVFLLVMSPRSEDSHWVQCELSLALELKKPIYPLLLEGRRWLSVAAIQTVDVTSGELPPARFFEAIREQFSKLEATAQAISIREVTEERIANLQARPILRPQINNPPRIDKLSQPIKPVSKEDSLASEQGVDYTRLRDLLQAKDWKAADQATADLMCKVMNRQKEGWLRVEDIENFPCQDLRTIDQLWVKYSNGHFGFSVQKEIKVKCVSWEQFCMAVGWATKGLESKLGMDFSKISLPFGTPSLCRY